MGQGNAQKVRDRIREKPLPDRLPANWEKLLFTYTFTRESLRFMVADTTKEEALEQIYGSGYFQDRQLLLTVAHSFLTKRADPDVVLRILKDVRKRHFLEHRKRSGKLTGGALRRERDRLAENAQHALTALQGSLIGDEPSGLSESIDTVLEGLFHPAFRQQHEVIFSKGAPVQPWIKKAETDLKSAGVPAGVKGFQQELLESGVKATPRNLPAAFLMAIGVIRYRTK